MSGVSDCQLEKAPNAARKRKTLHPFDVTISHSSILWLRNYLGNPRDGGEVSADSKPPWCPCEVWPLRCGCRGVVTSQGGQDTCVASRRKRKSANGQGCSSPFRCLSALVTETTRIPWSLPRPSTSLPGVLWWSFGVLCPNRVWFPWRFRALPSGLPAA